MSASSWHHNFTVLIDGSVEPNKTINSASPICFKTVVPCKQDLCFKACSVSSLKGNTLVRDLFRIAGKVRFTHSSAVTPYASAVMMIPAITTPQKITGTAFLSRRSISAAISDPVHAPVPGSGIATNSRSPHAS